jgi:hypothetical protein
MKGMKKYNLEFWTRTAEQEWRGGSEDGPAANPPVLAAS